MNSNLTAVLLKRMLAVFLNMSLSSLTSASCLLSIFNCRSLLFVVGFDVNELNENQFQAMDIIAGRICPELGGSENLLEIRGFNYYWNSQLEVNGGPLDWPDIHQKRMPFSELLKIAYDRYRKPLFISETGHFGTGRVEWLEDNIAECRLAKNKVLI
jgi:hypothetical protein